MQLQLLLEVLVTNSSSRVTGNINTDTKITTNVYMQGMAIKLV